MEIIKSTNLLVRFLLEICLLVVFGYWGYTTGGASLIKILLSLGSVLAFALLWGIFLAPKSSMRLEMPWSLILEAGIFGLSLLALYSTGKRSLAIIFSAVYIFNKILLMVLRQG